DFRRRAALLVVGVDAGGDAPPVVLHRNGVVGVDGDDDFVAVARQRLVDGVVHHLEHHVVQARAVRGVADVHAGAVPDRVQTVESFEAGGVVFRALALRGFGGLRLPGRSSPVRAGALHAVPLFPPRSFVPPGLLLVAAVFVAFHTILD